MKPNLLALRQYWPDLDERLAEEHLRRLDEAYFEAFSPAEISVGRSDADSLIRRFLGRLRVGARVTGQQS